MKPKEKAKELIDKMSFETHKHNAKHCALIAVDEILESEPRSPSDVDWDDAGGTFKYYYEAQREQAEKFWQEVKKEIEAL